MKALFVTAVSIEANASAGAETINIYINEFSGMGVQVDVLAKSTGRYEGNNITYHLLGDKVERKALSATELKSAEVDKGDKAGKIKADVAHRHLGQLVKMMGWILYPQNRFLYKTNSKMRRTIIKKLKVMKEQGYYPDVIFLETTKVLLLYREIKSIYPKAVLAASMHDVAYQGSERKAALETGKLKKLIRNRYLKYAKKYEIQALMEVDLIVPHNKGNIRLLKKEPGLKDKKYFPLVPYYDKGFDHLDDTTSQDILFYGLMSRPENYESALWFIKHVMDKISGNYRFIVMGGNPPEHLQKYSSERVCITGFVDDEKVKEYYEKSMCFVAPLLHGSGIKTKILSAFSAGLPILTNTIGIEGIEAENGQSYIHCETEDDYLNAIYELSWDKEKYHKLCSHARQVIDHGYNHHKCAQEYLALLEREFLKQAMGKE